MTPSEILDAVNLMTPEELTAKVAVLQGLSKQEFDWRAFYWVNSEGVEVHDKDWFPPTSIAAAWGLLPSLSKKLVVCIAEEDEGLYQVDVLRRNGEPFERGLDCVPFFAATWDEVPLAITRASVWWMWCEGETK